ncbi:MAG: hypothetical protein RSC93_08545 [Erysipelotrichaceae bacterium]
MKEKIHNFKDSINEGKKGEKKLIDLLLRLKGDKIAKVIDVSDNQKYTNHDIDVFIKNFDSSFYAIEIKTDSQWKTGNIFYEEMSCIEKHTIGCFDKTRANVMLYYFIEPGDCYIIYDMKKFREWYDSRRKNFKVISITNYRLNETKLYHGEGRLIPRSLFEKEGQDFMQKVKITEVNKENAQMVWNIIQASSCYKKKENIVKSQTTTIWTREEA